MKVHIQVKLFFYDVNVIAMLGESEVLAGEPFQGILAVGQAVNLTVHILDLGAVPLDQLFLIVDLEAGPDPADDVVLSDKSHHDEENGGDANGITNKRAPFSVLPIQITIPDVPELSHCFRTIFVQK
jgi:hypothetical protein